MLKQENIFKLAEKQFLSFVHEVQKKRVSDPAIRKALKKFQVKNLKINSITPIRAKNIFRGLQHKYQSGATTKKNWLENQRKIFVWCVICYVYKKELQIQQLNKKDLEYLNSMFPMKDLELIKFQIFNLIKKQNKNSNWQEEENQTLFAIMQSKADTNVDWTVVSKEFFSFTQEKYFRNSKQCRERWLNHLDPNKIKGKWTKQQDKILLEEVIKQGKKWSQISKVLKGKKNQHTVKNRYKSLLCKKQKSIQNLFLKEQEIIKLILEDLQGVSEQQSQSIIISRCKIEDQVFSSQQNQIEKKFLQIQLESNDKKEQKNQNISKKKKKIEKDQEVDEKNELKCEEIYENKHQVKVQNYFAVYGNGNDHDIYNQFFQNVHTPLASEKLNLQGIQEKSPANFLVSPYPTWVMQGLHGDSPQIPLLEDSNARFCDFMDNFIAKKDENQDENEEENSFK